MRLQSVDDLKGKHVRISAVSGAGMHVGRNLEAAVRGQVRAVAATGVEAAVSGRDSGSARARGGDGTPGRSGGSVARGQGRTQRMNNTEAAYAEILRQREIAGEVVWFRYECIKLKLAEKVLYIPDFIVVLKNGDVEAHEVKGFLRDDAWAKLKIAAYTYPFKFYMCKLVKRSWEIKHVPGWCG